MIVSVPRIEDTAGATVKKHLHWSGTAAQGSRAGEVNSTGSTVSGGVHPSAIIATTTTEMLMGCIGFLQPFKVLAFKVATAQGCRK